MRRLRLLIVAACAASLCAAQQSHVFPGTNLPIELAPKAMTADYFPMKIKEQSSGALGDYYSSYAFQFVGRGIGSGTTATQKALNELFELLPVSWTKNESVDLYGEKFLVTYIWEPSIDEITAFSNGSAFKNVQLKLKLIKSNQIGTIEPFPGLSRESYLAKLDEFQQKGEGRRTASSSAQTESLSRIKQYSTALMIYLADYDDIYPYVQSSKQLKDISMPYMKNDSIAHTTNPNNQGMFLFNMALGGVSAVDIPEIAGTPLLFDPTPWPSGLRLVSFTDTHAKFVTEETWKGLNKYFKLKLKKTAKKPLKP